MNYFKSKYRKFLIDYTYFINHYGFKKTPFRSFFYLFLWRIYCWLKIPVKIYIPKYKLWFYLYPEWRGVSKLLYIFRENYDEELAYLNKKLKKNSVFIDIGGCIGIYSLVASRIMSGTGKIITFEPSLKSYDRLNYNIKLNKIDNIKVYNIALGDKCETARLYHHEDSSRNRIGISKDFIGYEDININTLDEIMRDEKPDKIDLIKVDVEGVEELVFKGGKDTLTNFHPDIIFEVNTEAQKNMDLKPGEEISFLKSLGYEFFEVTSDGNIEIYKSSPSVNNVIAIHKKNIDTC